MEDGAMDTVFLIYSFRDEDRVLMASVEVLLGSHDVRAVTGEVLEEDKAAIAIADSIRSLVPRGTLRAARLLDARDLAAKGGTLP